MDGERLQSTGVVPGERKMERSRTGQEDHKATMRKALPTQQQLAEERQTPGGVLCSAEIARP